MPKQFNQQRNGRRTDSPDDFKSLLMQVFIVTGEESSQQGQRTPGPLTSAASALARTFGSLDITRHPLPSHAPGPSSRDDPSA